MIFGATWHPVAPTPDSLRLASYAYSFLQRYVFVSILTWHQDQVQ